MTRRSKRQRKPYDPHRWFVVRDRLWCWVGGHSVGAGTRMRERRGVPRTASCAECLGITPPADLGLFTMNESSEDVRARQVGGD